MDGVALGIDEISAAVIDSLLGTRLELAVVVDPGV